jgi:hypothetical protein
MEMGVALAVLPSDLDTHSQQEKWLLHSEKHEAR